MLPISYFQRASTDRWDSYADSGTHCPDALMSWSRRKFFRKRSKLSNVSFDCTLTYEVETRGLKYM